MIIRQARDKKQKGFTFIELLVVITIVGILFAAGVVAYGAITVRSRNARRQADLEAIRQSLEMCRSLAGEYPATILGSVTCTDTNNSVLMTSTPLDPKPCEGSPEGDGYSYNLLSTTSYVLTADCTEPVGTATPYEVTNP